MALKLRRPRGVSNYKILSKARKQSVRKPTWDRAPMAVLGSFTKTTRFYLGLTVL